MWNMKYSAACAARINDSLLWYIALVKCVICKLGKKHTNDLKCNIEMKNKEDAIFEQRAYLGVRDL